MPCPCAACRSGGGGGSKGPSVLDKRGQEEKCPHCDRVFKQSGRLRDHIAKQHADQEQEEAPPQAAAAAAAVPDQKAAPRPPQVIMHSLQLGLDRDDYV